MKEIAEFLNLTPVSFFFLMIIAWCGSILHLFKIKHTDSSKWLLTVEGFLDIIHYTILAGFIAIMVHLAVDATLKSVKISIIAAGASALGGWDFLNAVSKKAINKVKHAHIIMDDKKDNNND